MDDGRIITIARYDQAPPAHLDRARLEACGIDAMVAGDVLPGLLLFNAIAGASVVLQVFEKDKEAALAVLNGEADEPEAEDAPALEPGEVPRCPFCRSERLRHRRAVSGLSLLMATIAMIFVGGIGFIFGLGFLVLLVLVAVRRRRWHCAECGHSATTRQVYPGAPGTRVRHGGGPVYW